MSSSKLACAQAFGNTLDQDDFEAFKKLIATSCTYKIGDRLLKGPDEIAGLYESNMKEGQQKFDFLEWGKSEVKKISENKFEVYFSDFLKHKGISHNYKCKQILTLNNEKKVINILHCEIDDQRDRLMAFYKKVGLK